MQTSDHGLVFLASSFSPGAHPEFHHEEGRHCCHPEIPRDKALHIRNQIRDEIQFPLLPLKGNLGELGQDMGSEESCLYFSYDFTVSVTKLASTSLMVHLGVYENSKIKGRERGGRGRGREERGKRRGRRERRGEGKEENRGCGGEGRQEGRIEEDRREGQKGGIEGDLLKTSAGIRGAGKGKAQGRTLPMSALAAYILSTLQVPISVEIRHRRTVFNHQHRVNLTSSSWCGLC